MRQGDDQWFDIVKWALFAMIEAEERGITAANVEAALKSPDPNVQRMLGVTGDLGKGMGLDNKWAYNIIKRSATTAKSSSATSAWARSCSCRAA